MSRRQNIYVPDDGVVDFLLAHKEPISHICVSALRRRAMELGYYDVTAEIEALEKRLIKLRNVEGKVKYDLAHKEVFNERVRKWAENDTKWRITGQFDFHRFHRWLVSIHRLYPAQIGYAEDLNTDKMKQILKDAGVKL